MTVGEALGEARTAAGLSVAEVSERTRIRETVIRGIEQDDFAGLGGDLYVRGYLRAIAGAVGVDPQPLIHEFDVSRTGGPVGPGRAGPGGPAGAVPSHASAAGAPGRGAEQATAPEAGEEYGSFWSDDAVTDADPAAEAQMMPAVTDSWWPEESELPEVSAPSEQPALPEHPAPAEESALPEESGPSEKPGPFEEPAPAVGVVWTAEPEPGWEGESQSGWEAEPRTTVEPGWSLEPPTTVESWPAELLSLMEPPGPAQPPASAGTEWTMQIEPAAHPAWADAEAPRPRAAHSHPSATAPGPGPAGPPRKRGLRVAVITVLAAAVLAIAGVASGQIISRLGSTGTATPRASGGAGGSGRGAGALPTASQSVLAGGSSPTSPAVTPTSPATTQPGPVQQLAVRAAEAFGPGGVADGDNPERASYAITPNSPRPWRTDWYSTAKFGNLQQGTGLLLDMGHSVTVTSVTVRLGSIPGADLQVRVGNTPVLSDLPAKASATDAGGQWTLHLKSPASARYVVIWFTLLPPDGTGTYRASIYGVTVAGRP